MKVLFSAASKPRSPSRRKFHKGATEASLERARAHPDTPNSARLDEWTSAGYDVRALAPTDVFREFQEARSGDEVVQSLAQLLRVVNADADRLDRLCIMILTRFRLLTIFSNLFSL